MILETSHLVKRFESQHGVVDAVNDVSLRIESSEFVALYGPSGCGKSTLLMMAGGLLSPDDGRLAIDGVNPYDLTPNQRASFRGDHIGFVFQQFYLIPYLDVLDNVLVCELAGEGENEDLRARATDLLEMFNLSNRLHHVPSALSVGEQQRVALARAILRKPKLLLADEPTGNLDPENAKIILDSLSSFARDGGAVLMVTHNEQARNAAGRAIHLVAGMIAD